MDKRIPIIEEKDIEKLLELALKNEGVLTAPTELSQMLINVKGVSINSKPRKDGRFQGYIISENQKKYVYGKTKDEVAMQLKFYLKNGLPKRKKADTLNGVPTNFNAFAMYYFENFRKKRVAQKTFRCDLSRYRLYLKPHFEETSLKKITPKSCQDLLEKISADGKGKTADEIYSLMSIIFTNAIKHGVLNKSPLSAIYHERHERQHGKALTKQEEEIFKAKIGSLTDEKLKVGFALMLCTGARPNELSTAQISNQFIVLQNSKRKTKKVEFKRVPILNFLAKFLPDKIKPISTRTLDRMRTLIRDWFPEHKLYDLRTTFYTRCKEYGVSEYARDFFVGHSLGEIGNSYTDLSDEYLLKEAEKLNNWLI